MKALITKSPSETSSPDDQKIGPPLPSFLSSPPRWPPPPKLQFGSNSPPFGLPPFPNGSTPNLENKFPMSSIENSTSDSIPPTSALEKFSLQAPGKISPPLTTECVPTPSIKKIFSPFGLPPLPEAKLTTTTASENPGFGEASGISPKAELSPQKSIFPSPKSGFPSPPHLPKLRSPSDLLPPPPNVSFKLPPVPSPPSLPTLKPPPPPTVTIINNINLPPIPNEILPQRAGGSFLGKFFFFFIRCVRPQHNQDNHDK
uniref:Uncharacterized protein n=1 Tax=Acrobeloides nanus TaxID=290746 RepID=A0A914CA08_9BILA